MRRPAAAAGIPVFRSKLLRRESPDVSLPPG
jgi:hypothetical protein